METPTPENIQQDSTDSYIPRISQNVRSWPALLARNYYNLNTIKLILTFLINIILLSFKVGGSIYIVYQVQCGLFCQTLS